MLEPAGAALRFPGPAEVRRLLDAHGLAPSRRRGQNFVVDANTARAVVRRAGVGPGALVAEIGPGLGALSLALAEAGARVVAVEVDGGLVRALDEVLGDVARGVDEVLEGAAGVAVVHADALETDWAALLRGQRAMLVANLPYSVATALLLRALEAEAFDAVETMVQREVGERWVADVGDPRYSGASVRVAAHAEARVDGRVSRQAFWPQPSVDSVTVRLEPRPWTGPVAREEVLAMVRAGFAQRRKRLRNTLAGPDRAPGEVEAALAEVGADPGARPEELDLAAWTALTSRLARG